MENIKALEMPDRLPSRGRRRALLKHLPSTSHSLAREFILRTVASVFEIDSTLLLLPTRGNAATARARQVAMYLAHVGCGLTLTHVGEMFGRDRTTVAHACHVVEEQREDVAFDRAVDLLEQTVGLVDLQRYCKWVA